jgi:hypothetical protein
MSDPLYKERESLSRGTEKLLERTLPSSVYAQMAIVGRQTNISGHVLVGHCEHRLPA